MIIFGEEKEGRRSVYSATFVDENGEITQQRTVTCPLYYSKENGVTYFLLYDDNMVPISEAFAFLNHQLRENPYTTRARNAYALRLLYCFLSLTSRTISDMNNELSFSEFVSFIRGIHNAPEKYALLTERSNVTINGYFAVYREYFKFIEVECKPLFNSRKVLLQGLFGNEGSHVPAIRYNRNIKTVSNTDRYVPKYISPDEFKRIIKVVRDANDLQGEVIIYLMYGSGLRLGEVLGLTFEDIGAIESGDDEVPVLRLRNRLSDKPFQFAKLLPHVQNKREYASKSYKAATTEIVISHQMSDKLLDYVGKMYDKELKGKPERLKRAEADLVSNDTDLDTNYYLFLNKYGSPLSDQVWNLRLRQYFIDSKISIDTRKKENNLSHRFRHGFAMLHILYTSPPMGHIELQKLMRHRSLTSTMVYYNPTPQDELKLKSEYQDYIAKNTGLSYEEK